MNHTVGVGIYRRQSVEAIVLRACRHCGAPAVYKSKRDAGFDQWPGVLVPPNSPAVGKPVGATCPNCQRDRPMDEDRGEIWAKEFGGASKAARFSSFAYGLLLGALMVLTVWLFMQGLEWLWSYIS